jgi:hypothetical protein
VPLPGGLIEDDRMAVRGPVATPSGFLLFIREKDRREEALWRSDDGMDWERVPLTEGWSLRRSWVVAQPWPWRSLVVDARTFPGYMVQPSLLLTSDGGLTWCRADSPGADFKATDAAAGPDGSLIMVGGGVALEWNAWVIHSMHEPVGAGDGEAFPCEHLPAEIIDAT